MQQPGLVLCAALALGACAHATRPSAPMEAAPRASASTARAVLKFPISGRPIQNATAVVTST